jgi:hypothetical protein
MFVRFRTLNVVSMYFSKKKNEVKRYGAVYADIVREPKDWDVHTVLVLS